MAWAWASLLSVTLADLYVRLARARASSPTRRSTSRPVTADDRTRRSQTLPTTSSSSAPAAPGCGRRSRRSAAGATSGSSASRCSARPTRSWPRAASRRRSATSTPRDTWQTHFRDTMVGGKMLNNPRMAAAPRAGGAGPGPRAGALGRGLRPDPRRPDPPAAVRRPLPPAPRPRRRPDRARDDPDAPGPRGRGRDRRSTWSARSPTSIDGPRPASPGRSATGGRPAARSLFPAKAIVLATGGIGKAYEITSNSWEYSGDGHALAYRAGAELIDMEFVQFHPTGMVWPPGVRGLLVTEAVRGEGGILRNKDGERFMWKYLPEDRRARVRRDRRGGRALGRGAVAGPHDRRAPAAGAVDPRQRRAGDLHRGPGGSRLAARRRLPRHQLPAGRPRPPQAAVDVRAVQGARRRRHHDRPDGGRARRPTT